MTVLKKARISERYKALRCMGSNIARRLAAVGEPVPSVTALAIMKIIGITVKPITQMIYGIESNLALLRFITLTGLYHILVKYLFVT